MTTLGDHLRHQLLQHRQRDDAVVARLGVLQHQVQNVALARVRHPGQRGDPADERAQRGCDVRGKLGTVLDQVLQNEVSYVSLPMAVATDAQLLIVVVVVPIVRHEPRQ